MALSVEGVKEDDLRIMEEQSGNFSQVEEKRGQGSRFSERYGSDTGSRERRFTDHGGSIGRRCKAGKVDRRLPWNGSNGKLPRLPILRRIWRRFCSCPTFSTMGRIEAAPISLRLGISPALLQS